MNETLQITTLLQRIASKQEELSARITRLESSLQVGLALTVTPPAKRKPVTVDQIARAAIAPYLFKTHTA